jgi:hypothetical protein
MLYISSDNASNAATTIPTKPRLSEDDALDIMKADLEPRVAPASIDRMFVYGR